MVSGEAQKMKRPPMAWNDDTGRFDFLRKKKTFCDRQSEEWQRLQVERAVPTEIAAASSADPPPAPTKKAEGKAGVAKRGLPNADASGKSGRKGKTAGEAAAADAMKQKTQAEQKEITQLFKKTAAQKKNYTSYKCSTSDVATLVSTDVAWKYFNNDMALKDLRAVIHPNGNSPI